MIQLNLYLKTYVHLKICSREFLLPFVHFVEGDRSVKS